MPGDNITSKIPEGMYSKSRAAQLVPMPYWTLHRWLSNRTYIPKHNMQAGQLKVHVLNDDDIEALRAMHKPATRKQAG